jgi:hypothetical protein
MKIKRKTGRLWWRLGWRMLIIATFMTTICVFMGVRRIDNNQLAPDLRDGDLVFYERLFAPNMEDVVVWKNGDVGRFDGRTDFIGRVVLLWRGREI